MGNSTSNPARIVRAAAIQMTSGDDVGANLETVLRLVRRAAARGLSSSACQRISRSWVPTATTGWASPNSFPPALPTRAPGRRPVRAGPILGAMQALARDTHVHLMLGGFPEATEAGDRIYNTCVLLAPDGALLGRYRKIHLFDVDLPGGARFRESDSVEPGTEPTVVELPWGETVLSIGLSVCYDLRFPELYRRLVDSGARVLAIPAAFTAETGKDHWHVLLRARAIENQAFVFAPAQVGHHGGARRSYGHALIADPWGVVLAECGEGEGIAFAELDLAYQDEVRRRLPCLAHRRVE